MNLSVRRSFSTPPPLPILGLAFLPLPQLGPFASKPISERKSTSVVFRDFHSSPSNSTFNSLEWTPALVETRSPFTRTSPLVFVCHTFTTNPTDEPGRVLDQE